MKLKTGLIGAVFAILFFGGSFLFAGPVQASVNDFQFSNFKANYQLSRNEKGQSEALVTETFVVDFPQFDQNKGMVRAIPVVYQEHPVDFEFISLTRNGQTEPVYSKSRQNSNEIIETGTDQYLRGPQTFVFTYKLTNVTQTIGNTQEFYWDIIGDQFDQTFLETEVSVHLSPGISNNFTKEMRCYIGAHGQTGQEYCEASYDPQTATASFKLTRPLPPLSNLTIAMQFMSNTFESFSLSPGQKFIVNYLPYIIAMISIVGALVAYFQYRRYQTPKSKKAIIPEYIPPSYLSVMSASGIVSSRDIESVIPAQIIDLAVKHKIRIIETDGKGILGTKKVYTIELINDENLLSDEIDFARELFGSVKQGAKYVIQNRDYKTGEKLREVLRLSQKDALVKKGYLKKSLVTQIWPAYVALAISITLFSFATAQLKQISGTVTFGQQLAFYSIIISVVYIWRVSTVRIYTEKGREMQNYLEGLKMYIKMAEVDRIKYLQSPTGAERVQIDTNDSAQMIKLYERVLPYAVFFNLEKEWSKVLEVKYRDSSQSPVWYSGNSFADGLMLSAFTSGLRSSVSSSFHSSIDSSGSGISGGFAGGGGGGGGGGGR